MGAPPPVHTLKNSHELPESAHTQMYTITLVKSLCCVDQWPNRSSRKVANGHFFFLSKDRGKFSSEKTPFCSFDAGATAAKQKNKLPLT